MHEHHERQKLHTEIQKCWEYLLREDPLFATSTGCHDFNHLLPDNSPDGFQPRLHKLSDTVAAIAAIDTTGFSNDDLLNRDIFLKYIDNTIRRLDYKLYYLPVSNFDGIHLYFFEYLNYMPFSTVSDYTHYLIRLELFAQFMESLIGLMRQGIAEGFQPVIHSLHGLDKLITPFLVADPTKSIFFEPFRKMPPFFSEGDRATLVKRASNAIVGSIVPGYRALLDFIEKEYRGAATERTTICRIPRGEECYRDLVSFFTTSGQTAQSVHATGLQEVARIEEEIAAILGTMKFTGTLRQFKELIAKNPANFATNAEGYLKEISYILKKMDGQLPSFFKTLPRIPCGIKEVPSYSAPTNAAAYYLPPAGDGSTAGYFYANTYELNTRPLFELEALCLHEAVPGHHLQFALAQELTDLMPFRKFARFTPYLEGWALYAERLGIEAGFYTTPYTQFGRLNYEILRAVRLVVDTGLHAFDWSRAQAIEYMATHTALSIGEITREVDRYIVIPGQALSYKIGELTIRELRAEAERRCGARFDIRGFHDHILIQGGMPLDLLKTRMMAWIEHHATTDFTISTRSDQ